MKYTIQERVFLVKKYFELNQICLIQRAWSSQFKNLSIPNHKIIKNIVSNFEKTGSVAHAPPKHKIPDPKRENAKNQLENMISEFPSLSIRKAASAVNVSPTLCIVYFMRIYISAHINIINGIN